jgi:hypothetical protein
LRHIKQSTAFLGDGETFLKLHVAYSAAMPRSGRASELLYIPYLPPCLQDLLASHLLTCLPKGVSDWSPATEILAVPSEMKNPRLRIVGYTV